MSTSIDTFSVPRPNSISLACVRKWEQWYRWHHKLIAVGPLLLLGQQRYRGLPRTFPDRTVVYPGDMIGSLHFDNFQLASLAATGSRHAIAWRITRMLRTSLEELAQRAQRSSDGQPEIFHGITWMRAHGLKVGFVTEQMLGWRCTLLRWQFGLLRACFAPALFRDAGAVQPREFWITRQQLATSFAGARDSDKEGDREHR